MIKVVQGFKLLSRDPVDWRLSLTKEQMRSVNDNQMPDRYFSICKDDGMLYCYNKLYQPPAMAYEDENSTGKFVLYAANKIESVTIDDIDIPIDDDGELQIPVATKEKLGVVKPGTGIDINKGIITVNFNAIDDNIIPASKINFGELTLDANP